MCAQAGPWSPWERWRGWTRIPRARPSTLPRPRGRTQRYRGAACACRTSDASPCPRGRAQCPSSCAAPWHPTPGLKGASPCRVAPPETRGAGQDWGRYPRAQWVRVAMAGSRRRQVVLAWARACAGMRCALRMAVASCARAWHPGRRTPSPRGSRPPPTLWAAGVRRRTARARAFSPLAQSCWLQRAETKALVATAAAPSCSDRQDPPGRRRGARSSGPARKGGCPHPPPGRASCAGRP
mmetsp:Transcript_3101/g.9119  ORF Transcript_3101/g.9119 Transcript_3101/m.9119 type:complete len:239 (-) Transcript_3101:62-778(-)